MTTYPFPEVYSQEVLPPPEPRFSTAVPVFLGRALQGPVNDPTLLYLWPQFKQMFGQPFPNGYLHDAVRGFFENGGTVAYVVRLDESQSEQLRLRAGLTAVAALEEIDLICAPDVSMNRNLNTVVALQTDILTHCQQMGDRFAILDTAVLDLTKRANLATVQQQRNQLDSSFGALYFPWVTAVNPQGTGRPIPPCGHIAGIYARSDQAVGVHKAPANEEIVGIRQAQTKLSKSAQTMLFASNINYLRLITGRGTRVWGARTLSSKPEWQHINVCRLLITVHRWLEQFMTNLPFEPNNGRLWVRITREVEAYLKGLFEQGALKGETHREAFYVKCDGEINNANVRDAGIVMTQVGLAPAVPSEFIDVLIVQNSSGVTVTATT